MAQPRILWLANDNLYSARRAREAANALGVTLDIIDIYDLTFAADGEAAGVFAGGQDVIAPYDALIARAFMPFVSECLTLARLFRMRGKVVIDESLTSEGYAMSKMNDYILLATNNIGVPRTRQFCSMEAAGAFADEIGYPCVLKGAYGAQGRHVHKVNSRLQLHRKMMRYKSGELLVQEFLDAAVDYRIVVIGYRALPVYVSRKPREGEFRTNFEWNEEVMALPIFEAPQLQDIAERASLTLGREFAGVDIRCRGDIPLVLEVNRRPGYKEFEAATGMDVATAFIEYVLQKCAANAA